MKPTRKRVLRYLLTAIVIIGAAFAVKTLFFASEAAPAPVTTEAMRGDIESTVLATGTLEAYRLVSVGAQVSGQLKTLKVDLGDVVKQDDLLAEIDSTTQQNTIRNAEAQLLTAQAQRQAQAAALKQAQLTYQRQKELLAIDATSRQDFEAAEASLATIRAQMEASDAGIAQSKIAVDTARVNLGYTQIQAPMDGTVVALIAQEGQTLNANQTAPTILKLAQLDKLTVKAQISEGDVVRVKPGQQVYFTILGEPDKRYYATLRSVEPAPESIQSESSANSASGTSSSSAVYYNGRFDVDNPDGTLRISMTAQVHIVLDSAKEAVLVPSTAVRLAPGGKNGTVRVMKADGQIEPRRVQVGIDNNIMAQIVSGLEAGERVVTGSGAGPSGAPGQANRPRTPSGPSMMRMR
ncbi:efflux RND transporter periplasmic adaptor subunit [Pusillimonas sp. CC-YST705]|uniref:Efflux RND transporter periplasmic adaptor subunit n=1 Tax=Mesopusillimonas faecipullorum TaxID=2755040 RepID=A0ABS8C9U7_9BURK|nr:efflux RND transporter periplasmic adaptor subunit [Mesopusillimonas faecipullorum]MCB5362773.1 efflux RND transporter periplasmic adaptor subunit [Mesopusillimonas faecipullorum]